MIGWVIFAVLAIATLLLLWRPGRLDRAGLMLAAAAMFVAAAGYAWQGSPGQPGAPFVHKAQQGLKSDTLFAAERQRFLNRFGETGQWLGTADAMNRLGEDQAAVGFMHSAVTKHPRDPDLWIGYANALFVLADNNMTPAVALAFDRAQALDPNSPAPGYFRGLAAIQAGDMASAEQQWRLLYLRLPAGSPWRQPVEERLAMFDYLRAATMGGVPTRP